MVQRHPDYATAKLNKISIRSLNIRTGAIDQVDNLLFLFCGKFQHQKSPLETGESGIHLGKNAGPDVDEVWSFGSSDFSANRDPENITLSEGCFNRKKSMAGHSSVLLEKIGGRNAEINI